MASYPQHEESLMSEPSMSGYRTGKICYLEIPAVDAGASADFYAQSFGWSLREHDDGSVAFDDTIGGVSGMFVLGRPPASEPGLVVSIMVADAQAVSDAVLRNGGQIVKALDPDAQEKTVWFRDPAGNVLGIYEQDGLAAYEATL
jgi:predicted enzyme related to lactoylglutathione lyase